MKPVELNLASRPFRNDTPIALLLGALAVAAVAFTAYNAQAFLTADAREAALREELTDHRARMERMSEEARVLNSELAAIDVATLESQAAFVAAVLQERNFSWTTLFNELEQVIPWNVRLASIRPEFTPGSIKLSLLGTAKDDDAFFDFQDVLEGAESFGNVLPTQWERKEEGSAEISFTLSAVYRPKPAADEGEGEGAAAAAAGAVPAKTDIQRVVVDEPAAEPEAVPTQPAPRRGGNRARGSRRAAAGGPAAGETKAPQASAAPGDEAGATPERAATVPAGDAGSTGGAAASAGESAAGSAAGSGTAGGAGTGLSGFARTRGEAPPSREVRTVERENPAIRPSDPNDPKNPPEIIRDAQGNPIGIKPRVSPLAEDGPVKPTGEGDASGSGDDGSGSEEEDPGSSEASPGGEGG